MLPLVSRNSMSLGPSPSKSPVPTTDQIAGRVATLDTPATETPFMNQIARSPLVSPHRIGLAIAVEIARPQDRPGGRRNDAQPPGRDDLRALHEPDRSVAAGVAPQNVGLAVAVEIGGAGDRPARGDVADQRRRDDARPVHEPDRRVAAGVAPQQVALAVAVEVVLADDRPDGVHSAEPGAGCDLCAVHQPDRDVAAGVAPGDVALGVAVEVVAARERPEVEAMDRAAQMNQELARLVLAKGGDVGGAGVQQRARPYAGAQGRGEIWPVQRSA